MVFCMKNVLYLLVHKNREIHNLQLLTFKFEPRATLNVERNSFFNIDSFLTIKELQKLLWTQISSTSLESFIYSKPNLF